MAENNQHECPELIFNPCKRTHVRGRCDTITKPVLNRGKCENTHVNDKVMFVKFDGVLYAVCEHSKTYAHILMQQIQAEAAFKHLEESEILQEHHALAEQIMKKVSTAQALMISNITDNKIYGTICYEDLVGIPKQEVKFEITE